MSALGVVTTRLRLGFLGLCWAVAAPSCNTEPGAQEPKPCCEQPQIPPGVAPFTIVEDETTGPSDGQKMVLRAALGKTVKRDEIYPVLHTLYRHAMTRGPFEPINFQADLYPSEGTAKAGNESTLLARISRDQGQMAPRCDNKVGYDFGEQVDQAFGASLGQGKQENADDSCKLDKPKVVARYDEKFTHKPSYKLDEANKTVEVTYPYLEMGKDEYVPELKLTSALTYWMEFVTSLFHKVPDLGAVSFVGVHKEQPILRITLSRKQFDQSFSNLQETISAHAAVTFQSIGTGRSSDKAAEKEQETWKLKTYKEALAELPKAQVTIAPKLAKAGKTK